MVSTVSGLALLFSYRTSTMGGLDVAAAGAGEAGGGAGGPAATSPGSPTTSIPGAAGRVGGSSGWSSTTTTTPAARGDGTAFTGSTVTTRYGPVQVQITVSGDRITDVTALQAPDRTGRDQMINGRAPPVLRQQVLSAQGAGIDGVSGATVTSSGYRQSLQAALEAWPAGG